MDHPAGLEPASLGFEARAKQYGFAGLFEGWTRKKKERPGF